MLNALRAISLDARARIVFLALFFLLTVTTPALADVAPPESPPGSGIVPGEETTQVQMVSEQVTLTVAMNREGEKPRARTEAIFQMRNLGTVEEQMDVRFPLNYNESADYRDMFPEIQDIQVRVDGKAVSTFRTDAPLEPDGERIPWASFPVAFPPGQDVTIQVSYTTIGFGYEPFIVFRYILETGAGWKGTIGSGEVRVILPYEANLQNVVLDESSGYGRMTEDLSFSANQVSWRFANLEPEYGDNFSLTLIEPFAWQKVLRERENTARNPNDGEAWGRLGKAIKEVIRFPKGYLRDDQAAAPLYDEAVAAYERSVTLLPRDALWHYGFADLLWSITFYNQHLDSSQAVSTLVRMLEELNQSLALDPNNQDALRLADWIANTYPGMIVRAEVGYNFPGLTATPTKRAPIVPAIPTVEVQPTSTPLPPAEPTAEPTASLVPAPSIEATRVPEPAATRLPFCGGAALLLFPLAWIFSRRSRLAR